MKAEKILGGVFYVGTEVVCRGSVIVSFLFGAAIFHEKNLKAKFVDLLLVSPAAKVFWSACLL